MSAMSSLRRKNSEFFNIQTQKLLIAENARKEREEQKLKNQSHPDENKTNEEILAQPVDTIFPEVEFADNK